jgi:hypothetical protein
MPSAQSAEKLQPMLLRLAAEMGRPYPNRQGVEQAAIEARALVSGASLELATGRLTRPQVFAMLKALTQSDRGAGTESWDATSQRFLAATAIFQSAGELARDDATAAKEQISRELHAIRERLLFPADGEGARYSSPRNFDDEARRQVENSFSAIGESQENW